ncbi:MAG: extracellular solute-binding protein, partial [Candidatus Dormiibacterota bacterium]
LMGALLVLASCASSAPVSSSTTSGQGGGLALPKGKLPALQGSTFTYWYGLIFSDAANQTEANQIKAWGRLHHINVDAVPVNQNDTVTKVSAALVAHTMPDALDMGDAFAIQLKSSSALENITALKNQIGTANGGWLSDVGTKQTDPAWALGVPYGASGNLLARRTDVLNPLGLTKAPETWAQVVSESQKAQDPPSTYGMGWGFSNVGDSEGWVEAVLHDYGVRIANNAGTSCTLDTQATRNAVSFLANAASKRLMPPGSNVWDGAGNNLAYESGKVLFTEDTGSIYLALKPGSSLQTGTALSTFPGGPKMRVAPAGAQVRAIPTGSKNKVLAESLIQYLEEPAHLEAYYKSAIYGPVLNNEVKFPVFNNPSQDTVHAALKQLALTGTTNSYPDKNNAAFSEYSNTFQASLMLQAVVVNHEKVDQAVTQAQAACQKIYSQAAAAGG